MATIPDRSWITVFIPTPLIFRYQLPLIRKRTIERILETVWEGSIKRKPVIPGSFEQYIWMANEAEFLDESQTKVLRVFLLANHSHLYCTALPWDFDFFKLKQPLTVSTVQLLYDVKEKGGQPDRNLYTPSLLFQKSKQKPQVWKITR